MIKDAYWFSHDSNARNDNKLLALRLKYDWKGYGLFWAIVEKLREATDYVCVKDYNLIAYDLRVDASIIKSIIEDFGLFVFTDCGKYFYSERLMRSMDKKEEKSTKAKLSVKNRWDKFRENKAKEFENDTEVIRTYNESNTIKVKESKVKEKKESVGDKSPARSNLQNTLPERKLEFKNQLKPFVETYGSEMMNKFYSYWTEKNNPGTKMKFELEKTWELPKRLSTWASRETGFKKPIEKTNDSQVTMKPL